MSGNYSIEDMRNAIMGKGWKSCLSCSSTGWENWDDDGNDLKPGPAGTDRCVGECETCDGLGFIPCPIVDKS